MLDSANMRAGRFVSAVCAGVLLAGSQVGAQVAAAAGQAGGSGLQGTLATMAAEPPVARAHWGIAVAGLDGSRIAGLNDGQFFQPASNAKLFTTAAAMALLGAEATVETRVIGRGPLLRGTLTGDLALLGAGDANFAADDVPYLPPAAVRARREGEAKPGSAEAAAKEEREEHPLRALERMADQVVQAGVKVVAGDVVGEDTLFVSEPYPEAWGIDDMVWGYGAPVSALAVHDNQMVVRVRPGAKAGEAGVVEMERGLPAWYTVEASGLVTGEAKSGTHVGMDRNVGSRVLRVWGTIGADAKEDVEVVAIDEPAEFAARALREMLEARGVEVRGVARAEHRLPRVTMGFQAQAREAMDVGQGCAECVASGGVPGSGQVLATARSPTLAEDELLMNKVSQNLHAELLLERLGRSFGEPNERAGEKGIVDAGSRAQGARVVRSFLERAGLGKDDFVFFDGSGLSAHDLVTPQATAKLLAYASTQPWFAGWKATLPVGGEDGSLAGRFAKPPLRDHVVAKTGTLGEARALSGYLQCASGRTVVFSIMVDTHAPGDASDREVMDRLVGAIYEDL